MIDEAAEARVQGLIAQTQVLLMEDAAQTPIDLEALHVGPPGGIETLLALSNFSSWFLDEYGERYSVRSLYRQITYLAYLAPLLRHNMRQMILTHLVLKRTFDAISKPGALFNLAEYKFFKATVNRLWNDVRTNFLSNILRYFSGANLPSLVMMIKLLVLLASVKTWTKERAGKKFPFVYKTVMRELIIASFRNHYQEMMYQVETKRPMPDTQHPLSSSHSHSASQSHSHSHSHSHSSTRSDREGGQTYPDPSDPDRLVPAKPSFLGANKTITPLQLTNVANELWGSLHKLKAFEEVLSG